MSGRPLPPEGIERGGDDRRRYLKELAQYLRHGERTVGRWEATEGLPVRRHVHEKRGSVYAYRSELDAWRERRTQRAEPAVPPEVKPRRGWRRAGAWGGALLLISAGSLSVA